jgi:ElaB/YqjD/DUF883 family membrane-anchored ribosome-binding protein
MKMKDLIMETHFPFAERTDMDMSRERLVADLKTVIHDIEELIKAAASEMGGKMPEVRLRLEELLARAKVTTRALENRATAGAEVADHVIRTHPYESLGIALALGLLVGVLVGRR